jgi:hypothetical protein
MTTRVQELGNAFSGGLMMRLTVGLCAMIAIGFFQGCESKPRDLADDAPDAPTETPLHREADALEQDRPADLSAPVAKCAYADPCPAGCQTLGGSFYDPILKCKRPMPVVACFEQHCRQANWHWCNPKTGGIIYTFIDCGRPFGSLEWQTCDPAATGILQAAPACTDSTPQ